LSPFHFKVKYRLVELQQFSGLEASVYSVFLVNEGKTLFDKFIEENKAANLQELLSIVRRLKSIGNVTGAREQYFKLEEGKPGDLVCALYDEPEKYLRLYGIRHGKTLIILGGGGLKDVRAWQDDPKLTQEVKIMMQVSNDIDQRMQEGDIYFSDDYFNFEGELTFNDYDQE